MYLTLHEKRMISSPSSLSVRQRRNAKYKTGKKIQQILSDVYFILENHSTISKEFSIDVLNDVKILKYFTSPDVKDTSGGKDISEDKSVKHDTSNDPDLL